jgi:hypothetical protein
MTLVSVTAYHSLGGEVEASNTPTIRRLTPSCRHQLPRIARLPPAGRATVPLVRINQNTALSTRRWFRGGRPLRLIRKVSKYAHSSSVISPRIKAASQRAALNQFAILASTLLCEEQPRWHAHPVQCWDCAFGGEVRSSHSVQPSKLNLRAQRLGIEQTKGWPLSERRVSRWEHERVVDAVQARLGRHQEKR